MASELRVDRIIPVNGVPTGGGGGVIQVVNSEVSTTTTQTGTSWNTISGLSASITRRRSDSKVIVVLNADVNFYYVSGVGAGAVVQVVRDNPSANTVVLERSATVYLTGSGQNIDNANTPFCMWSFDDNIPDTTSAITYSVRVSGYGANSTIRFNNVAGSTKVASLTVMEVSG